ncbi:MAG: hypothetical protein PHR53_00730 [Bacteroidales bacterium]|nr:hypothetical protein [Bacteroidales bacterium]
MSDNTVKYSIQIIDQFGKVLEKFYKGIDGATEKVEKFDKTISKQKKDPFNTQKRSLSELRENVKRYQTAAENSFRLDHIKKYNKLIEATQKKIKNIEDAAETCKQRTEDMFDEKGVVICFQKLYFCSRGNNHYGN